MISAEYTAGFFDGEGCVQLRRTSHGKKQRPSMLLLLTISQVDRSVLEQLQIRWGGSIKGPVTRHRNSHARPVYHWRLTHRKARVLLAEIRPYVIVKRAQVELALEFGVFCARPKRERFVIHAYGRGRGTFLDTRPEVLQAEDVFRGRLRELNRRGIQVEKAA